MAKIHVKRLITVEYEYPFTHQFTNGESFEEIAEWEKNYPDTMCDAIVNGDYTETVEVTLVPEVTDDMPPSGNTKVNLVEVLQFINNLREDNQHDEFGRALEDMFSDLVSAGCLHGYEVPLVGVREHFASMAKFENDASYTAAVYLVVDYLNQLVKEIN